MAEGHHAADMSEALRTGVDVATGSGRGRPRPYEGSTESINCEPGAALFTGIVEEVGTIREVREEGNGVVFTIACGSVREGLGLGDSVAIDGACLTVTSLTD